MLCSDGAEHPAAVGSAAVKQPSLLNRRRRSPPPSPLAHEVLAAVDCAVGLSGIIEGWTLPHSRRRRMLGRLAKTDFMRAEKCCNPNIQVTVIAVIKFF